MHPPARFLVVLVIQQRPRFEQIMLRPLSNTGISVSTNIQRGQHQPDCQPASGAQRMWFSDSSERPACTFLTIPALINPVADRMDGVDNINLAIHRHRTQRNPTGKFQHERNPTLSAASRRSRRSNLCGPSFEFVQCASAIGHGDGSIRTECAHDGYILLT